MSWNKNNITAEYKVILVGDSSVGKTSLLRKYLHNIFSPTTDSTIGASFSCTYKESEGKTIKLNIWDTAGQERFRAIIDLYYRGADAVILVCDLTNDDSIDSLDKWIQDFYNRTNNEDAKLILVANKVDKYTNSKVLPTKIIEIQKKLDIPFILSSARTGENVNEIFNCTYQTLETVFPFKNKQEKSVTLIKKPYTMLQKWCSIL